MRKSFVRVLFTTSVLLATLFCKTQTVEANPHYDEKAAGKTYTLKVGVNFTLTLHSTYWNLTSLPTSGSIRLTSPVVVSSAAVAPGHPPGLGKGSLMWKFRTVRPGTMALTASRNSCGEAMACSPSESNFEVKIKVIR
jgi:predicted secreted protein